MPRPLPLRRGGAGAAAPAAASARLPLRCAGGRRARVLGLGMSSAAQPKDFTVEPVQDKIPVTLLSGFLGAGKTTLLREMLQNKGGLKVGVVVNDMAAINIDAKLVKSDSTQPGGEAGPKSDSVLGGGLLDTSDVLELQNGCACCSASEELLSSVMKLLLVSAEREEPYDRIIIEMSGVAEPKNIRKQFFDAAWGGHPALEYAELKNMVTVVDAANFLSTFQTADAVLDRPDLIEEESSLTSAGRAIVDLLTEQVEVADYVLLNKADLLAAPKLDQLNAIITALNPDADVIRCSYGKVDLDVVLGQARDKWVADADDEDDFRVSVRAAKAVSPPAEPSQGHSHGAPSAAQGHTHDHAAATAACADEECSDPSHGHSHNAAAESHGHSHSSAAAEAACADEECSDPSHGHGHADAGHSHTHSHASTEAACADPECADPSHSHGETHAHSHGSIDLSPEDKFGINSFVYTRRRPFHPDRLKKLIAKLPVSAGQV